MFWTRAILRCLPIRHFPSPSIFVCTQHSLYFCFALPFTLPGQFDLLYFCVLILYWLYRRNWPHTVLPVVLVGHYEGGVARAVEDHDSHTVHTWYFGLGNTLFWSSLLLQKLQNASAAAVSCTSKYRVFRKCYVLQFDYFRWDKWDGPLKTEVDINLN